MRVIVYTQVRLFGEALAACLSTCKEIVDVDVCHRADSLANEVIAFAPDLVLIDVTNEQAVREARALYDACPDVCIVALALPEVPEEVIACADAGFVGYVPRHASVEELRDLMQMALRGECVCNPKIAASLLREVKRRRGQVKDFAACEPLTQRECEVLSLVGQGLCNKAIARELSLSLSTVKNHLHSIFSKLRVACRAEAVARLRNEPWLAQFASGIVHGRVS